MEGRKGRVCVTGGTGYLASWLIKRLLQHGYSVNATVRPQRSGKKKDLSFLQNLGGASDRLRIFDADFENPDSFGAAIEGCVGVFHVAHPTDFPETETVESISQKCVDATLGILRACVDSNTVKRVVYTSSLSTVAVREKLPDVVDEDVWSDVDFARNLSKTGASYFVSKTATERAALEFAEKHCLEVVSVIPSWIHGPFICPSLPRSVCSSLALFLGNERRIKHSTVTPMVHTDDVAMAHIHLFEHPQARGRYLCSSVEVKYEYLREFLRRRYPHFLCSDEFLCRSSRVPAIPFTTISSKKLLGTGFTYKYGLEEMYDEAIQCCNFIECCKQKGFLCLYTAFQHPMLL
ncbi:vestitone reductase-like [Salvia miltiorrhiza]|uniref:vestitone reductase-like n=1 Tax=Salvia miltiorrhiza TaxID=226208 RepID=UPI0025AB5E14|nr:vestitone reductase-like [Salvia miltiorrhiza]